MPRMKAKNPQDATLRNVRAAHHRLDKIEKRLDRLEGKRIQLLEQMRSLKDALVGKLKDLGR